MQLNANADYNNEVVMLPNNAQDQIDDLLDQITGGYAAEPLPVLDEVTVTSSFMPTLAVLAVLGLVFVASGPKARKRRG